MKEDRKQLQKRIGYFFHEESILEQALTHSSYSHEHFLEKYQNNERLEFLGDAVLELVSSDYLFREHKTLPEGELTKLRASMVCEQALAFCADEISLGEYLRLGKGEENTGGRERASVTSDAMEALIGAIYLDGGFANAKAFITSFILNDLENKKLFYDSKSILQEMVQREFEENVSYELLSEEGPDHNKQFCVQAEIAGKSYGIGRGRTKKAAQQVAAYETILLLKNGQ